MKKSQIGRITQTFSKLCFTAVLGDVFYIIYRLRCPVTDLADAAFVDAVPDMLRHMLLCLAIIAGFMAAAAYIYRQHK